MKKLLVLLLASLIAISFVSCDNSTKTPGNNESDVTNPNDQEGIVRPEPNKGEISEALFVDGYNIVMSLYSKTSESGESKYIYDYFDTNNNLVATVIETDEKSIATIKIDGIHLKNGDEYIYDYSNGNITVNGEPSTEGQKKEYDDIIYNRAVKRNGKLHEEYHYTGIGLADGVYNITSKMESIFTESNFEQVGSEFRSISFNNTYGGITYFAFYYDASYDGINLIIDNAVCEIKGISDLEGVYSVPSSLLEELMRPSDNPDIPEDEEKIEVNPPVVNSEEKTLLMDDNEKYELAYATLNSYNESPEMQNLGMEIRNELSKNPDKEITKSNSSGTLTMRASSLEKLLVTFTDFDCGSITIWGVVEGSNSINKTDFTVQVNENFYGLEGGDVFELTIIEDYSGIDSVITWSINNQEFNAYSLE